MNLQYFLDHYVDERLVVNYMLSAEMEENFMNTWENNRLSGSENIRHISGGISNTSSSRPPYQLTNLILASVDVKANNVGVVAIHRQRKGSSI